MANVWPHVRWRIAFPIVAALLVNCFIAFAVWPGFMSWDSLFALKQLRTGITVSAYPPMVSYIWAVPDLLIPGPGGMLLLQNGILLVAMGMLFHALGLSVWTTLALFFLFLGLPGLIGPMLVVWKDVGMSAFLLLSAALIVVYVQHRQPWLLVAAMVMMVIGGSYRLNAFPALVPLILAVAIVPIVGTQLEPRSLFTRRSLLRVAAMSTLLSSVALVLIALSLSFRLPDLKPLPRNFNSAWLHVYDLLGISACTGRVLIPNDVMRRPMSSDDMRRLYEPRHVQMSFDSANPGNPDLLQPTFGSVKQIEDAWWRAIWEYPGCYLEHRLRVVTYLLGANTGDVFYVTHARLDPNDLGLSMKPTRLTAFVVHSITGEVRRPDDSSRVLARLWVLIVAGGCVLVWLFGINRSAFWLAAMFMSSGLLYLAGNAVVAPAADVRYQHWVAVCMFAVIAFGAREAELVVRKMAFPRPATPTTDMPA